MKRPSKSLGFRIALELKKWSQTSEFEEFVRKSQISINEREKERKLNSELSIEQLFKRM